MLGRWWHQRSYRIVTSEKLAVHESILGEKQQQKVLHFIPRLSVAACKPRYKNLGKMHRPAVDSHSAKTAGAAGRLFDDQMQLLASVQKVVKQAIGLCDALNNQAHLLFMNFDIFVMLYFS